MALKFDISGKAYAVAFGYGATKILGESWGSPGVLQVFERAIGILGLDRQPKDVDVDTLDGTILADSLMQFESLDILADVIKAGIAHAGNETDFEEGEVQNAIMQDVAGATQIFMAFVQTMPRPKQSPVPAQKKRSPRKKR